MTCGLPGCRDGNPHRRPLFAKDTTSENERNNTLFAFVGEKIELKEVPWDSMTMDACFTAKYKILLPVYGYYDNDTITFTVYDHYGYPDFARFKNVLLYVSEYKGKYYHEKYQYSDVYRTKNGRWAGTPLSFDNIHCKLDSTIQPEKIAFLDDASYPLITIRPTSKTLWIQYDTPYYKVKNNRAVAMYGVYMEDLFRLNRDGVLTNRDLFGHKTIDSNDSVVIQDVQLEEIKQEEPPPLKRRDKKKLAVFWKQLTTAIRARGIAPFRDLTLDSVYIDDDNWGYEKSELTDSVLSFLTDKRILDAMSDPLKVTYDWTGPYLASPKNRFADSIAKSNPYYRLLLIRVRYYNTKQTHYNMTINLVETNDGYRITGWCAPPFKPVKRKSYSRCPFL